MATLTKANALMDELTVSARPTAIREDAALRAFARKASGNATLELLWWDNAFWSERQKEALFNVRQEEVRQYLPLESVKEGMFKVRGVGMVGVWNKGSVHEA
jgi:oligopeptidase A